MFYPKWAPDGKKMVFVTGTPIDQVLLMENFLPKSEEAGKSNVARPRR